MNRSGSGLLGMQGALMLGLDSLVRGLWGRLACGVGVQEPLPALQILKTSCFETQDLGITGPLLESPGGDRWSFPSLLPCDSPGWELRGTLATSSLLHPAQNRPLESLFND